MQFFCDAKIPPCWLQPLDDLAESKMSFCDLATYCWGDLAIREMSISGGILQFSLAVSWQAGSFHRDFCSLCDNGETQISLSLFTLVPERVMHSHKGETTKQCLLYETWVPYRFSKWDLCKRDIFHSLFTTVWLVKNQWAGLKWPTLGIIIATCVKLRKTAISWRWNHQIDFLLKLGHFWNGKTLLF